MIENTFFHRRRADKALRLSVGELGSAVFVWAATGSGFKIGRMRTVRSEGSVAVTWASEYRVTFVDKGVIPGDLVVLIGCRK